MADRPSTVEEFLASLSLERRATIEAIRATICANIDPDFEEGIQYGMLGWFLPHSKYPAGYHCDPSQPLPFASVASQKNHIGIYLFCLYCDPQALARFETEWRATGRRLDMGKSCVRVTTLDDVPLDVLARAIRRVRAADFVASYEAGLSEAQRTAQDRRAARASTAGVGGSPVHGAEPEKAGDGMRTARKSAAKPATTKRATTKGVSARKVAESGAPTKRSPAKRTPAKRTPAKRTPAKKTPTRNAPTKKTPTKKTPTKRAPTKRAPAKGATARKPAVRKPAGAVAARSKAAGAGSRATGGNASRPAARGSRKLR